MSNASPVVKHFLGESEMWWDYKPEVRTVLKCLADAGFTVRNASNGGGPDEDFGPEIPDFVEELTAAEEAYLYVTSPTGKRATIYLVMGNSPGELVSDYTAIPELEAPLEAASQEWWGKEQPMEPAPGNPDRDAEKAHFDKEPGIARGAGDDEYPEDPGAMERMMGD